MSRRGHKEERIYIDCECRDPGCIYVIDIHDWDWNEKNSVPDVEFYLHQQLAPLPYQWWKRVWPAIKYLFGRTKGDQHFTESVWKEKQVRQLKDVCNKYLKWLEEAKKKIGDRS